MEIGHCKQAVINFVTNIKMVFYEKNNFIYAHIA